MEDLKTATKLIFPEFFLARLDLKDAYYAIPIHLSSRMFLRFSFEGTLFQFTCLPFGLSTSPYIFTKVLKPVVKMLRLEGVLLTIYIDDLLFMEKDVNRCRRNVDRASHLLQTLGFRINWNKSCLEPATRCKFLGFIIDTKRFVIELTVEKKQRLGALVKSFAQREACSITEFSQLIGSLVAACLAVDYGWLYTKLLEREKL